MAAQAADNRKAAQGAGGAYLGAVEPLITIKEVAAIGRISTSTVRRLVKDPVSRDRDGNILRTFPQPIRIGKQIDRWRLREVAEYFGREVTE